MTNEATQLERRPLGRSELHVSTICMGTMTFGTPVAEPDAIRLVHAALDLGINFFDTADIYEGYKRVPGSPGGEAERILGKALKGRRQDVVITSKVGNAVGTTPDDTGLGRTHILRQLDASLERLDTDYLDVYELHKADAGTPLEDTLTTVAEVIRSGKVRHWGFSNFGAEEIGRMLELCDATSTPRPVVCQPLYNWLNRDLEGSYLAVCRAAGIAITPYQPLQGGLLTGKYKRGEAPPADSRGAEHARWLPQLEAELYDRVEAFEAEARALARTPLQHALRWLLDQPGIVSVVVGSKRVDQLKVLVAAA